MLLGIEIDTNLRTARLPPSKHLKAVAIVRNALLNDQLTQLGIEHVVSSLPLYCTAAVSHACRCCVYQALSLG